MKAAPRAGGGGGEATGLGGERGAHVDHQVAGAQRGEESAGAFHDVGDDLAVGQHQDDALGPFGDFGGGGGEADGAGFRVLGQGVARGGVGVAGEEGAAVAQQGARHGQAHHA